MSIVRPELAEILHKWREALFGVALALAGIYNVFNGVVLQRWAGYILILVGAAIIWEGVRRARFPAPGGGPGVVELDERMITYYGPLGGGSVSLEDVTHISIRTTNLGPLVSDLFWDFTSEEGRTLTIPGDAEGAEVIFDALASLPGANYAAATEAASSTENAMFVIWEKAVHAPH